jgi:hypothetical protein
LIDHVLFKFERREGFTAVIQMPCSIMQGDQHSHAGVVAKSLEHLHAFLIPLAGFRASAFVREHHIKHR